MQPSLRRAVLRGRPSRWVCTACRARTRSQTVGFTTSAVREKTKRRDKFLPDAPVRTRFAPSPTGYLHLGSLRTALFNYLIAKRTGGQFLLRIEDTDQKRTVPDAEQRLYEDLEWAGLSWDEGPVVGGPYGPYRQSERTALYTSEAKKLIASGHAYRCFCSPERLDTLARHRNELGLAPGYDGTCRHISNEESEDRASRRETHVVRLRVAEPYPFFDDIVYGRTGQNKSGAGDVTRKDDGLIDAFPDPILIKSDGHPTYHLANVVDDHHMEITHVIRGTEWMSSTPMHAALYKAFGWEPPKFGHVPLLVELSGQKLSKRNADIDISHFRDQGVMPGALVNFAVLLGWSHNLKSDVFTLQDLESTFNLKLTKGNATVAFEKMWFLQKAHARKYVSSDCSEFKDMVKRVADAAEKAYDVENLAPILKSRDIKTYVASILREGARNYTTPDAFVSQNATFFTQSLERPPYTNSDTSKDPKVPEIPVSDLHTAAAALSMVPESFWNADTHRANIEMYTYALPHESSAEKPKSDMNAVFRKQLYKYLRWALSAGTPGIPIPATMEILGREETVRRLEEARALTGGDFYARKRPSPKPQAKEAGEGSKEWMGSLAGAKSGI